jgi:putative FmdB family regulatory protein
MPDYGYQCKKCSKKFTLTCSFAEYGTIRVRCPRCRSSSVAHTIASFFAKTARKA